MPLLPKDVRKHVAAGVEVESNVAYIAVGQ